MINTNKLKGKMVENGYNVCRDVREIRGQSGISQQKFSDATGIPKRTIENWESGVSRCPDYTLRLLDYYVTH